jgi:hypothetical protein
MTERRLYFTESVAGCSKDARAIVLRREDFRTSVVWSWLLSQFDLSDADEILIGARIHGAFTDGVDPC